MKRRLYSIAIGAVALMMPLAQTHAADANMKDPDGPAAFAKMKTLVGEWQSSGPDHSKLTYELTGAGTTLLERETAESMPGMMTMFHLNSGKLMLTHYCMAGNQPRMQAHSYDAATGEIRFQFLDASNLKTPNDGHMHNASFQIVDHDHLRSVWEFYENGHKTRAETFEFTRVK